MGLLNILLVSNINQIVKKLLISLSYSCYKVDEFNS